MGFEPRITYLKDEFIVLLTTNVPVTDLTPDMPKIVIFVKHINKYCLLRHQIDGKLKIGKNVLSHPEYLSYLLPVPSGLAVINILINIISVGMVLMWRLFLTIMRHIGVEEVLLNDHVPLCKGFAAQILRKCKNYYPNPNLYRF